MGSAGSVRGRPRRRRRDRDRAGPHGGRQLAARLRCHVVSATDRSDGGGGAARGVGAEGPRRELVADLRRGEGGVGRAPLTRTGGATVKILVLNPFAGVAQELERCRTVARPDTELVFE